MNRIPVIVTTLLITAGCAHTTPPEPVRVRANDLAGVDEKRIEAGAPLIVEVREGEIIPLDLSIEGDLVTSPDGANVPLTAKRTFWIRVSKEGLAISRDGVTFATNSRVPGTLRLGVSATRAAGLRGKLSLTTPQP